MEIREATRDDVPRLVAMGQAQIRATYAELIPERPAAIAALMEWLIGGPQTVVLVAEDAAGAVVGMIGLAAYAHPMSGELVAAEVMWWVEPGARGSGVALLDRAEQWAAAQGAGMLVMVAPASNPRVGVLYQRRKYRPVETAYQRTLAPVRDVRDAAAEDADAVAPWGV